MKLRPRRSLLSRYYEERSAGDAIEALKKSLAPKVCAAALPSSGMKLRPPPLLAPKANVRRDGQWREIEAAGLVPGDRINLKVCYYYDYYLYY